MTKQVVQETERLKMDITSIQEIRWSGYGDMKIRKSQIFYNGNQQDKHEFGTSFVIKESLVKNIISFKSVSDRLCYIRLKSKSYNCTFISVNTPTEDKDNNVNDAFYDKLETVIDQIKSRIC